MMDAVVLDGFGDAGALNVTRVPRPGQRHGWSRVHLRAAALNWHDVLVRRRLYDSPLPHILGAGGAGLAPDGEAIIILP